MDQFPNFPEESAPEDPAIIEAKLIVRKEFLELMDEYLEVLRFTEGCGSHAQGFIDRVWKKILLFVKEHPEYKSQIPSTCHRCHNDGTNGLRTGIIGLMKQPDGSYQVPKEGCLIQ